jgi:hypothetical protein
MHINPIQMFHNTHFPLTLHQCCIIQLCVGGHSSPHETAGIKSTLPSQQKQQSNIFDDDLRVMHNLRFVFNETTRKRVERENDIILETSPSFCVSFMLTLKRFEIHICERAAEQQAAHFWLLPFYS